MSRLAVARTARKEMSRHFMAVALLEEPVLLID
jgi:hypothetical protein